MNPFFSYDVVYKNSVLTVAKYKESTEVLHASLKIIDLDVLHAILTMKKIYFRGSSKHDRTCIGAISDY